MPPDALEVVWHGGAWRDGEVAVPVLTRCACGRCRRTVPVGGDPYAPGHEQRMRQCACGCGRIVKKRYALWCNGHQPRSRKAKKPNVLTKFSIGPREFRPYL